MSSAMKETLTGRDVLIVTDNSDCSDEPMVYLAPSFLSHQDFLSYAKAIFNNDAKLYAEDIEDSKWDDHAEYGVMRYKSGNHVEYFVIYACDIRSLTDAEE